MVEKNIKTIDDVDLPRKSKAHLKKIWNEIGLQDLYDGDLDVYLACIYDYVRAAKRRENEFEKSVSKLQKFIGGMRFI